MPPRRQYLTRPGILGWSGIWLRCLSRTALNESTEQPDVFLTFVGRELNTLGPFMPMLPNLIVFIFPGAVELTRGTLQYLPLRLLYMVSIPKFGTIPSRIFQTYIQTYLSLLL